MKYKLKEIGKIVTGKTPPTSNLEYFSNKCDKYLFLTPRDMNEDTKYIRKTERYLTDKVSKKFKSCIIDKNSVCISCIGTNMGKVFMVDRDTITNQQINSITKIKEICNPEYIYYYFKGKQQFLKSIAGGSAMPILNKSNFSEIEIELPNRKEQDKVVNILSNIDKKIEINNKNILNFEKLAIKLFKRWFIDFEFPVKNKKTYKSSNGKMKLCNNREIPEDWKICRLGEFFEVITGKKDANASAENGKYPFFTCSQTISKTDEYSFDGNAILLAGNGDFNVKFYRGKFEAYQRTYVLIPENSEYLGFLYQTIKYYLDDITSDSRGSVIKFITKGNIENYKIIVPDNKNEKLIKYFNKFLIQIEELQKENEKLIILRNTIMPKLIKE